MKKFVLLVLVLSVLISACAPDPYQLELQDTSKPYIIVNNNVVRIVDEQAGVVCWIYSHQKYHEGGISCLPLADTLLGK